MALHNHSSDWMDSLKVIFNHHLYFYCVQPTPFQRSGQTIRRLFQTPTGHFVCPFWPPPPLSSFFLIPPSLIPIVPCWVDCCCLYLSAYTCVIYVVSLLIDLLCVDVETDTKCPINWRPTIVSVYSWKTTMLQTRHFIIIYNTHTPFSTCNSRKKVLLINTYPWYPPHTFLHLSY